MLDYRLYFFDAAGHHIDSFQAVEAQGDSEAIEIARQYSGSWPLELWQQQRRVKAFPSRGGGTTPPSGAIL
jgi:hypothetical protein